MTTSIRRKFVSKAAAAAVALALSTGFTACTDSDDNSAPNEGRTPISIGRATIGASSAIGSRATDAAWEAGDAIAITLHSPADLSNAGDRAVYRYTTPNGDGSFTPVDAENTAYYPADGSEVKVVAVYPDGSPAIRFDTEAWGDLTIDVTDQTDLGALDLMSAGAEGTNSATDPNVQLAFAHRLVKLAVTLRAEGGDRAPSLEGATLTLKNAPVKADFNAAKGILSVLTDQRADLSLPLTAGSEGSLGALAIILPGEVKQGMEFVISVPATNGGEAQTYTAKTGSVKLVAGTANSLTITVLPESQEATISGVSIEDWTTGLNASLIAVLADVDDEGGNTTGGNFQPTDGGSMHLILQNTADATDYVMGTYTYSAGNGWSSSSPLVWDFLQGTATYSATATYTPADSDPVTGEPDLLKSTISVPFGTALDFTGDNALRHAFSKLTVKVVNNLPAGADVNATRIDGLMKSTYLASGAFEVAPSAEPYTDFGFNPELLGTGDSHIVCPQPVAGAKIVVVSDKGNAYECNFSDAGISALEAGNNYTITLTLQQSGVKASFAVTDWNTVSASSPLVIDGVSAANGIGSADAAFSPQTGDLLIVRMANAAAASTEAVTGIYTYGADGWASDAPIYWDNLTQGAAYNVTASYQPKVTDGITQEPDVLENTLSGVAFGTALDFTGANALKHSYSKLTLKVVDANNVGISKVAVTGVKKSEFLADGSYSVAASDVDYADFTYTVDGVKTGEGHIVAPQTVGDAAKVTITNSKGNTYTYVLKDGIAELKAGTNHVLTLTVNATGVSASLSVMGWTDAVVAGEHPVVLDGLTTGSNAAGSSTAIAAAEGDQFVLSFYTAKDNGTSATPAATQTYTYSTANGWSADIPLYWDNLTADTYYMYAVYTPGGNIPSAIDGFTAKEKDILVAYPHNVTPTGGGTAVAVNEVKRGQALNITFEHLMAKVVFKLTSSDGSYSINELAGATFELGKLVAYAGVDAYTYNPVAWGTTSIDGVNVPAGVTVGTSVAAGSVLTGVKDNDTTPTATLFKAFICPQQWVASSSAVNTVATLTIGNYSYSIHVGNTAWSFTSGKVTTVNLNVTKTGVTIANGGIGVLPWDENGGSFDGSVDLN